MRDDLAIDSKEEPVGKPRVFVTRMMPQGGLNLVRQACDAQVWNDELPPPRDILLEKVRGLDGLLCLLTDSVDADLLDAAGPQLRVISNYAVGYDNVDVAAATARGIPVGNTPGVLTETTADMAFTLLLAGARRVVEAADYVRADKWRTWGPTLLLGHDVHGCPGRKLSSAKESSLKAQLPVAMCAPYPTGWTAVWAGRREAQLASVPG